MVKSNLRKLKDQGYTSIAICLAHSYTFPDHELQVASWAEQLGFKHISISHKLLPMIKLVSRGQSATADAYLTPHIQGYIDGFLSNFKNELRGTRVEFMQSDGGLATHDKFSGLKSILSGPAGGVVGYAQTSWFEEDASAVIGFDMVSPKQWTIREELDTDGIRAEPAPMCRGSMEFTITLLKR